MRPGTVSVVAELGGVGRDSGGSGASRYGTEVSGNSATTETVPGRTTIYFQGNRATRAVVSERRL